MNLPTIKAVLFDLDGTLIDAFTPIVFAMQQTLKFYELPAMTDAAIRRHTGRGDCSMTDLFGDNKEDATKHFLAIHDEIYLNDIGVLDDVSDVLDFLDTKLMPMGIVTSKGQHRAEAQLTQLGWLSRFGTIIGKLEGRAAKPNPEPIYLACTDLQVDVASVVFIGDGEADMKAAFRAGCFGIGITSSFSDEELLAAGASLCFANMEEVLVWLKSTIA